MNSFSFNDLRKIPSGEKSGSRGIQRVNINIGRNAQFSFPLDKGSGLWVAGYSQECKSYFRACDEAEGELLLDAGVADYYITIPCWNVQGRRIEVCLGKQSNIDRKDSLLNVICPLLDVKKLHNNLIDITRTDEYMYSAKLIADFCSSRIKNGHEEIEEYVNRCSPEEIVDRIIPATSIDELAERDTELGAIIAIAIEKRAFKDELKQIAVQKDNYSGLADHPDSNNPAPV